MKKQRVSETQIVSILKQYEASREALYVCREYGTRMVTKASIVYIGVKNILIIALAFVVAAQINFLEENNK